MTAWPVGRRPGPSTVHSRRPAGVRPAWGQADAGLWNADFCKLDFEKIIFCKKDQIWKLCVFHADGPFKPRMKKRKKLPATPTPQLNFVALCQNGSQLFFALDIIAPGAGGFFMVFSCEAGSFQRQFYVFAKCIFHEKSCYKSVLCHILSKFMFL